MSDRIEWLVVAGAPRRDTTALPCVDFSVTQTQSLVFDVTKPANPGKASTDERDTGLMLRCFCIGAAI